MPITLAQAKELSQDKLTQYVIDEFRRSPLINALTFDNTVKPQGGNTLAYVYNRITTQPSAEGRAITLVSKDELFRKKRIEESLGTEFELMQIPSRRRTQSTLKPPRQTITIRGGKKDK